jgi:hypothetical protein
MPVEWPLSAASEQWRTPPVSARLPGCLRSPGIDVSPKRIGGRACPTPSPPRSPFRPFDGQSRPTPLGYVTASLHEPMFAAIAVKAERSESVMS